MKNRKILALLACGGICLALAACQTEVGEPMPSSAAALSSVVESAPEPTEGPASSAGVEASPAPTPALTPGTDFGWLFANANPIQDQFQEDVDMAASPSALLRVYGEAVERWKRLIAIAYEDCLAVLPEAEAEQLKTEQAQWEAGLEEEMEEFSASSVDADGLGMARMLYDRYYHRAYDLCKQKWDADGVMPSFEAAMEEPEAAG